MSFGAFSCMDPYAVANPTSRHDRRSRHRDVVRQGRERDRDGISDLAVTVGFKVCRSEESMDISANGSVWGGIWVDLDGFFFPEKHWNDLPVALACEFLRVGNRVRKSAFRSHRIH